MPQYKFAIKAIRKPYHVHIICLNEDSISLPCKVLLSLGTKFILRPSVLGKISNILHHFPENSIDCPNNLGYVAKYKEKINFGYLKQTVLQDAIEKVDAKMNSKIIMQLESILRKEVPKVLEFANIVEADKNMGTCVINKLEYDRLCLEQIEDTRYYNLVNFVPAELVWKWNKNVYSMFFQRQDIYQLMMIEMSDDIRRMFDEKENIENILKYSYQAKCVQRSHQVEEEGMRSSIPQTPTTLPYPNPNWSQEVIKEWESYSKMVPNFYILPKIHKNPIKGRPIISYSNAISKQACIILDDALKIMQNKIRERFGNRYWSVNNSSQVIDRIKSIPFNRVKKTMIKSYDFTSMYTKIPIDELIKVMSNWYNELYTKTGEKFTSKYTRVVDNKYEEVIIEWTLETFIGLVSTVVKFTYFSFNGKIYNQVCGVPMGANCSPLLADLYLAWFEIIGWKNIHDESGNPLFIDEEEFKYNCRYLDDLLVIGTEVNFKDILMPHLYKNTMEITESTSDENGDIIFLDLVIKIVKGQYITKMYRKPGTIFNYPHYLSYIPFGIRKGIIVGETLRIIRNNQRKEDRVNDYRLFLNNMNRRGYSDSYVMKIWDEYCESKYSQRIDNECSESKNDDDEANYFGLKYNPLIDRQIVKDIIKHYNPDKDIDIAWKKNKTIGDDIRKMTKLTRLRSCTDRYQ